MVLSLVPILAPNAGIYHIVRRARPPFPPPDWEFAGKERFDDPRLNEAKVPTPRGMFRVIYAATDRSAAIRECIAHFRPDLNFLAALESEVDDDEMTGMDSLSDNYVVVRGRVRGIVPYSWLESRRIGHTFVDESHRFADLVDTESLAYLRSVPEIVRIAVENGIQDIDVSAITGDRRPFTQACAKHIYELRDSNGRQMFEGIRFVSRHGSERTWECWALFDDRLIRRRVGKGRRIQIDDPDFVDAVRTFDLLAKDSTGDLIDPTIESFAG